MYQKPQGNWMKHKKQPIFVYILAFIAALGGLLFGYDTGVISGAMLFVRTRFNLSADMQGVVVSAVLLGAFLGALFSGRMADHFGRRKTIITVALLFALGSLGTALAPNVTWLIIGRIIVGIAIGVSSYNAPLYIAEIAPPSIRGALVSLNQLAITFGIVVSYLVDYYYADGGHWRMMFGLAVLPAVVLIIGMFFLPETPRWLVSKGRDAEAVATLKRIRVPEEVEPELAMIKSTFQSETKGVWKSLAQGWVKSALVIGIGLAFFQQVTGINTIIYYAPTIFEFSGFKSADAALLATIGVGVVNMLMTVVALRLLDKWGRRPLLFTGLIGMIVSLIALTVAFALPNLSDSLHWITVASLMVYVASFAISLGPIFWLMISEIYPLDIRGVAMGISTMANWGFNWLVALTFLTLVNTIGISSSFGLYAILGILALIFCYLKVPETKGKSLEEIEMQLRKKS
jgi:sugar porter (SP) family MFS transporter